MAFSFTLPELQAELRALGHDGLPDHVILSFLSQLDFPLPSPSAPSRCSSTSLDSSGYDSEGSFCSTHSLSCGFGRPPNTRTCDVAPLSFIELVNAQPRNPSLCQESTPLLKSKEKLQVDGFYVSSEQNNVIAGMHVKAPFNNGNVQHTVRYCKMGNRSRSAKLTITEERDTFFQNVRDNEPEAGCEARGTRPSIMSKEKELDKQTSRDKIIEHYWISVGEEHMRAMQSKSTNRKQVKSPQDLEMQTHATSASSTKEGSLGYVSLIEKVEQCENELQCLTLRLQAQQCKKPWFLEAARKPSNYQREKQDSSERNNSVQALASASSMEPDCAHIKDFTQRSELLVTAVSNTHTCTENMGQESKSSYLDSVQECEEDRCKNLEEYEEGSEQLLFKVNDEGTHTLETESASAFSILEHNEPQEPSHHQEQGSDKRDEPDPSICSKSSSASYQHSRSSGDLRSNALPRYPARRRPCSTSQQQRRRGGKIDRVARFAEMQQVWKKDAFLVANEAGGKRKGVHSFHHHFSLLHSTRSY